MKKLLVVTLLSAGLSVGCSLMFARTSPLSAKRQTGKSQRPTRGLQITQVFPNSPAERAGLHNTDLITKYGEFEIVDNAGFFAAKNHYKEAHIPTVEIVVWRGLNLMSAQVPSGWVGVDASEYDNTSKAFMSLMREIEVMHALPPNFIDRGKYKFQGTEAQVLLKAKELIDQGEREGTLTPAQVLVDRIYMILDDAPAKDQQRLEVLLKELITNQPKNYIEMLGSDSFFKDGHYRAAIACFKEHLKMSSDDVSIRLNLGFAYNKLAMYTEANNAADYVFEHKLELSEYGRLVAYQVKATASLGLKDYRSTIEYAKKGFSIEPGFYLISLIQLAAAERVDLKLLEEATQQLKTGAPADYEKMKVCSDAVNAYGLNKAKQTQAARDILQAWRKVDGAEGKVIDYWRTVPNGSDVSRTFGELMKS
jgi:tetratricopeptide (TPR) repeat protein